MTQQQLDENGNKTRGLLPGLPGFPGGGAPGGPGGFPGGMPFPGGGLGPGPGSPLPFPGGNQGPGAQLAPPPTFVPQMPAVTPFAVDPGAIRGCVNRYVYIWQNNGDQYWMFLTHVGRNSISGFRWYGFGPTGFWLFFGLDLRRISQFICF